MTDESRDPAASLGCTLLAMLVFAATFASVANGRSPLDAAIIRESQEAEAREDERRAEARWIEQRRLDAPVRIADALERMERERGELRNEVAALRAEVRPLREELR